MMAEIGSTLRATTSPHGDVRASSEDISYRVVRRAPRGVPHGVWYPEDRACEVRGIRTGAMVGRLWCPEDPYVKTLPTSAPV